MTVDELPRDLGDGVVLTETVVADAAAAYQVLDHERDRPSYSTLASEWPGAAAALGAAGGRA